jgi:glycosyltransferase involved in cell wall biosynthesis
VRLLGHICTRNEVDRYLWPCLRWLDELVDEIVLFDDRSTDGTPDMARQLGARVVVRETSQPSFAEDESGFRQAGWEVLAERAKPNDWILCVDADEFLVGTGHFHHPRVQLDQHIDMARLEGTNALVLDVAEVWSMQDRKLHVRKDGYWGGITARRLVRFQEDGGFTLRKEGGGSVPTYAEAVWSHAPGLTLLHLGYATRVDRRGKHTRYSQSRGHNPAHVASILAEPTLEEWVGPVPKVLF